MVADTAFLSGLSTASVAQRRGVGSLKKFSARSYAEKGWRRCRGNARALRVEAVISKPPPAETEVVPVSPEDSIKVAYLLIFFSVSVHCILDWCQSVSRGHTD